MPEPKVWKRVLSEEELPTPVAETAHAPAPGAGFDEVQFRAQMRPSSPILTSTNLCDRASGRRRSI
jgi:hypothetical protein